ncbi:hypothetical protein [Ruegeria sp. HKCCSP351]|uniref:hypothetical protein n=1 Tax=Ruegeria sp. HKCCSP351 TaxID=2794832 RepID=UPI001AE9967E|nr:hypothetical protein [Ruegeria sp. HKCCSP351]
MAGLQLSKRLSLSRRSLRILASFMNRRAFGLAGKGGGHLETSTDRIQRVYALRGYFCFNLA